MGVYDSVTVACPQCQRDLEFQSKAGDCMLSKYTIKEVPWDIAMDLDGESIRCGCGNYVVLRIPMTKPKTVEMWAL